MNDTSNASRIRGVRVSDKHSPGPWRWRGESKWSEQNVLVDARGYTVAHTYTCDADWNTKPADRNLIAAAPELLDALEAAVGRCWCSEVDPEDPGAFADARCDRCADARALIRRVREGEPQMRCTCAGEGPPCAACEVALSVGRRLREGK